MLLQTSLFEVERTIERDVFNWLKQDIKGNDVGDGDDRVAVVVVVSAVVVVLAKLPIKSSMHQPA